MTSPVLSPVLKDPEWSGYMPGKTLLGSLGRPEDAGNVALSLASGETRTSRASISCSMAA